MAAEAKIPTAPSACDHKYDVAIIGDDDANTVAYLNMGAFDEKVLLRITNRATHHVATAKLADCIINELGNEPSAKHKLFTRGNVYVAIKSLIARNQVKVDDDFAYIITVTFHITATFEFMPDIVDELTLVIDNIASDGPNTCAEIPAGSNTYVDLSLIPTGGLRRFELEYIVQRFAILRLEADRLMTYIESDPDMVANVGKFLEKRARH